MIVEITGTHFQNKGAELMLNAVAQRLYMEVPDVKVAMQAWSGNYYKRAKIGLYQLMWYQRMGIPWSKFPTLMPENFRKQYGLLKFSEVDVILDASGFKFTDQWPASKTLEALQYFEQQHKRGAKLILMPQAFGPFEKTEVREGVKKILDIAELVFARDQVSYDYLVKIYGKDSKIKIAPDFTNLIEGSKAFSNAIPKKKPACIVPNKRMLDKTSTDISDNYTNFMAEATNYLIDHGYEPFILIHEKGTDNEIANQVKAKLKSDTVPVILEEDPLKIKGIIGQSKLFFGSRFHGLVSALAQGVPAIATGWSHKYEMLFQDYNCKNLILSPSDSYEKVKEVLNLVIQDKSREEIVKEISERATELKKDSEKMWQTVYQQLGLQTF